MFNKVWIVDDDSVYVFGLKRLMNHVDFCDNVKTYGDGYEALNKLSLISKRNVTVHPDLIILDLDMPHWDDWDF